MAQQLNIAELPIGFDAIMAELESSFSSEVGVRSPQELLGTSTTLLKMYQTAFSYYTEVADSKMRAFYSDKIR